MALVIVRNELNPITGKRAVLIQNDVTGEHHWFKFAAGMTAPQMRAEAQAWIDAEIARRQAEAAERTRIRVISNSVETYLGGGLNTAQRNALLNALALEWRG